MSRQLLALLGICACLVAFSCAADQPSFYDYLAGEWEIKVYTTNFAQSPTPEESDILHYSILKRNGSSTILDGFYTNEVEDKKYIQIEFDTKFAGVWYEKSAEDETATLTKVFDFSLTNISNGYWLSYGSYGETGTYQLTLAHLGHPAMLITIVPKEGNEIKTLSGIKRVPPGQKSFFQQYGFMIMIGVWILFMFMKNRGGGQQQPEAQQPAAQAQPHADGTHPRVEQLPDSAPAKSPESKKAD